METAKNLIKNCETLPSLPEVYFRIQQIVNDPDGSILDLAKAISVDPALTARVLKLVNSPFYGISGTVETVSRAASILGMLPIHDLVLATSVTSAFSNINQTIMDMNIFWRTSVARGVLARVLGTQAGLLDSERLFIAGLLCDIGHLVMYEHLSGPSQNALKKHQQSNQPLFEIERETIGFDYGEVGACLLESWNLPKNFQESIRGHTDLQIDADYLLEAGLLHIGNQLARNLLELENLSSEALGLNAEVWAITGLTEECLSSVKDTAKPQIEEVFGLILQEV